MKRAAVVIILVLAFLGLADAAYLAQHETDGTPLICGVLTGCNAVAQSPHSRLFGFSLGEYGMLFYAFVFVVAALELTLADKLLRRVLQVLAVIGIGVSLYSIYLQVFVIDAFCIYCLASAFITLLILVCASLIEPIGVGRAQKTFSSDITQPTTT